ncbi:cobyrinic acid ac-diamide synthase, partial [Yersinia pestis]
LLTLAPTNPSVSEVQQANDYLADFPLFTALSSVIHDRKVYRDVTAEGKGVIESNNPKAIAEFEAFMEELLA